MLEACPPEKPTRCPDLSCYASATDCEQLLNEGFVAVITKPFQLEELAETLEQLASRDVPVAVLAPTATAPAEGDFMAAMRANLQALQGLAAD